MYKSLCDKSYSNLVIAVRDKNEALILKMTTSLTVPSIFTEAVLKSHYERLNSRLHGRRGIVDTLAYKKQQFEKPTTKSCGRDRLTLSNLQYDISNLSEDVRIISRIAKLIGAELVRRRVAAMTEERHINTGVLV